MTETANNDPWLNWRKRLAGDKTVPTYETEPDQGYYRTPITQKTLGGATQKIGWRATAYFYDAGALHCVVDGQYVSRDRAIELWLWCVQHPITEEQYRAVADRGEPWFDAPQTGVPPRTPTAPSAAEAVIGHNQPPADAGPDPLAELRETIANAVGSVKDIKVTTDEEAQRAQGSRARLLELTSQAKREGEAQYKPHYDRYKGLYDRYKAVWESAETAAAVLRRALSDHETAKLKEQRRIEEEARVAAAAAEDAAAKARRNHKAVPPAPAPAPPPPERASTIKGGYGKAASVQMVKFAVVEDWKVVAAHYSGVAEIQVLLQRLANADAKAGIAIPGAKIDEKADVK